MGKGQATSGCCLTRMARFEAEAGKSPYPFRFFCLVPPEKSKAAPYLEKEKD